MKMDIDVHITDDGVKKYPPHKHLHWELMIYLHGNGFLYTPEENYRFKPGTMILVPPGIIHGSVSENGFKNISIGGEFGDTVISQHPISVQDNMNRDGVTMAKIIYRNRFSQNAWIGSLCRTLIIYLTCGTNFENDVYSAVRECMRKITSAAFNCELNVCEILNSSGYAEDYIRAKFKEYTGKTPIAFLTEIRINRAKFLIEIYGRNLSLQEVMLKCGFYDYVYFSKRFRQYCGISPSEYARRQNVDIPKNRVGGLN